MLRFKHRLKEPFGKAGLTVAILALVMALVGGAYAAGGLTKSQEKQVTKIAKKYAGKAGATGPAGAAGTNGTNGKDGTNGGAGANGKSVAVTEIEPEEAECEERGGAMVKQEGATSGVEVCNGEEGSPWTAGGTLPKGATEAGAWSVTPADIINDPQHPRGFAAISFGIPLLAAPTLVYVKQGQEGIEHATECPGTLAEPKAKEGYLCLYTKKEPEATFNANNESETYAVGVELEFEQKQRELAGFPFSGTWAVTAG